MSRPKALAPVEDITRAILRGHRVILDADLAALYGVTTKRLNEQVKRNGQRFPDDFMFRLTGTATPDSRPSPSPSTAPSWLPRS